MFRTDTQLRGPPLRVLVTFRDFITGMRRRKLQRQAYGRKMAELREREKRNAERRERLAVLDNIVNSKFKHLKRLPEELDERINPEEHRDAMQFEDDVAVVTVETDASRAQAVAYHSDQEEDVEEDHGNTEEEIVSEDEAMAAAAARVHAKKKSLQEALQLAKSKYYEKGMIKLGRSSDDQEEDDANLEDEPSENEDCENEEDDFEIDEDEDEDSEAAVEEEEEEEEEEEGEEAEEEEPIQQRKQSKSQANKKQPAKPSKEEIERQLEEIKRQRELILKRQQEASKLTSAKTPATQSKTQSTASQQSKPAASGKPPTQQSAPSKDTDKAAVITASANSKQSSTKAVATTQPTEAAKSAPSSAKTSASTPSKEPESELSPASQETSTKAKDEAKVAQFRARPATHDELFDASNRVKVNLQENPRGISKAHKEAAAAAAAAAAATAAAAAAAAAAEPAKKADAKSKKAKQSDVDKNLKIFNELMAAKEAPKVKFSEDDLQYFFSLPEPKHWKQQAQLEERVRSREEAQLQREEKQRLKRMKQSEQAADLELGLIGNGNDLDELGGDVPDGDSDGEGDGEQLASYHRKFINGVEQFDYTLLHKDDAHDRIKDFSLINGLGPASMGGRYRKKPIRVMRERSSKARKERKLERKRQREEVKKIRKSRKTGASMWGYESDDEDDNKRKPKLSKEDYIQMGSKKRRGILRSTKQKRSAYNYDDIAGTVSF